ncbi:MAG TPA: serine hydrolase [Gemmatimonadaceae bacterium]|nr:serine hydrolase [Gemmatimonadaceae bacterium]
MSLAVNVRRSAAATAAYLLLPLALASQAPRDPGMLRLEAEINRLATIAAGRVGVGIVHLESGRELFINGKERFPMASTYKVAIAATILSQVDNGKLRLDSMVQMPPPPVRQARVDSGGAGASGGRRGRGGAPAQPRVLTPMQQAEREYGTQVPELSVHDLLERMLLVSNNTATDVLLALAGGGSAVNARLAALGISGISVDRPTSGVIAAAIGARGASAEEQAAVGIAFYADTKDTSTPEAMARLLLKIWRREALSPTSTDFMLDLMRRCYTGTERIRKLLPPDVVVMDKTGTLYANNTDITNDVGIITLPNNAGHLFLTVFTKEAKRPEGHTETAIAQIARAAYDYFVFNPIGAAK